MLLLLSVTLFLEAIGAPWATGTHANYNWNQYSYSYDITSSALWPGPGVMLIVSLLLSVAVLTGASSFVSRRAMYCMQTTTAIVLLLVHTTGGGSVRPLW